MEGRYISPILATATRGEMWDESFSINRDGLRCKFYVPVCYSSELEDKVLQENWNVKDIRVDQVYRTFLELNADLNHKMVKVVYSNKKYEWISVEEWKRSDKYSTAWIHTIKVAPYFYLDAYGQDMVAGQLKFMEICIDAPLEEDKISEVLDTSLYVDSAESGSLIRNTYKPSVPKPTLSDPKAMQLVNIVTALGLTPKEAIKILIEEV